MRICRACRLEHDPRLPCARAARMAQAKAAGVVANRPAPPPVVANSVPTVVANSRHGCYADKARRAEYMREYMRQRRAAGRAE